MTTALVPAHCPKCNYELRPVVVVHYEHKHGDSFTVCMDEEAAIMAVRDWAFNWWDQEFPDEPYPDEDNLIDEYFDRMGAEGREEEWYSFHNSGLWELVEAGDD